MCGTLLWVPLIDNLDHSKWMSFSHVSSNFTVRGFVPILGLSASLMMCCAQSYSLNILSILCPVLAVRSNPTKIKFEDMPLAMISFNLIGLDYRLVGPTWEFRNIPFTESLWGLGRRVENQDFHHQETKDHVTFLLSILSIKVGLGSNLNGHPCPKWSLEFHSCSATCIWVCSFKAWGQETHGVISLLHSCHVIE